MREHPLSSAASWLFTPADRPDRYPSAERSGADVIVLDLEDAVAPLHKDEARGHVRAWSQLDRLVIRVNAAGTPWHVADMKLVRELGVPVLLPKAESGDGVAAVVDLLGPDQPVVPLIETARGHVELSSICAVAGVIRLAFGNVDMAAELGVDPASHQALLFLRSSVVAASAAGGLTRPVDGVTTSYQDDERLEIDVRHAAELGFAAKLCIHPRQVPVVRRLFAPTPDEIAWARRVEAVAGDGASALDGTMIDRPVVLRARDILRRATVDQEG